MKKLTGILLIAVLIGLAFSSCRRGETSDTEMNDKMETLADEGNRQVGVPAIVNFQEKKTLKWIYELCDQENLICHAYLVNVMTGDVGRYLGKCLGYGIPYSAQFSNPEKFQGTTADKVADFAGRNWVYSYELLPQAEPNGIFKPEGLSATWLIMIDPEGNPRPMYVEPEIIVSPYILH